MVERLHKSSVAYRLWEPTPFQLPPRHPVPRQETQEETQEPESDEEVIDDEGEEEGLFLGEDLDEAETEALTFPTAEEIQALQDAAAAEGHAEGFSKGHEEGHQQGYALGHKEGHTAGHTKGEAEGLKTGHERGFAQGYQEGRQKGEHEAHTLHSLLEKLDEALTSFDVALAEEVAALAVEIARRVVGHALQVKPEQIIDVVREALKAFPYQEARIHLHTDDLGLVRDYFNAIPGAACEHRFMEDTALLRGGCRIDVGASQLDARLQTRWQRVLASMGGFETAWQIEQIDAPTAAPTPVPLNSAPASAPLQAAAEHEHDAAAGGNEAADTAMLDPVAAPLAEETPVGAAVTHAALAPKAAPVAAKGEAS